MSALAWAAVLGTAACGGPARRPVGGGTGEAGYYEPTTLLQGALTRDHFQALNRELPRRLGDRPVLRENARGQRQAVELADLSPATRQALWLALNVSDDAWGEIDVRARLVDDTRVPVTIRQDAGPAGPLTVREGSPGRGRGLRDVSADELRRRYGIGPLSEAGGATWDPEARGVLGAALSLLAREEREVVAGVPFVRRASGEDASHGALYRQVNCQAEILVFDSALKPDDDQFVGEPEAPVPASVRALLHEIGHAVHQRPAREAYCEVQQRREALNTRIDTLNARVESFNARGYTSTSAAGRRELAAIQAEQAAIAAERATFDRVSESAAAWMTRGPLLADYEQVMDGAAAPTRYGETAPAESFAESFSLYRTDPAALKRAAPRAWAFFEAGGAAVSPRP